MKPIEVTRGMQRNWTEIPTIKSRTNILAEKNKKIFPIPCKS